MKYSFKYSWIGYHIVYPILRFYIELFTIILMYVKGLIVVLVLMFKFWLVIQIYNRFHEPHKPKQEKVNEFESERQEILKDMNYGSK